VIGYLMDTNHVSAFEGKRPSILAKLRSLPSDTQIRACTITLGEIEAGYEMTASTNPKRRNEAIAFINSEFVPNALPISHSTGYYYAKIMGRIWKRIPPIRKGISTDLHLANNGVNVNDVWIVASAWEHGLTFLTNDRMPCIRPETPEVTWDDWY
jgi:predicted nucleic acid-binding protein